MKRAGLSGSVSHKEQGDNVKAQTVLDTFNWRIHWVYCHLSNAHENLCSEEDLKSSLEAARSTFRQLIHEYKLMMDAEYESEVEGDLLKLEAFERLSEEVRRRLERYNQLVMMRLGGEQDALKRYGDSVLRNFHLSPERGLERSPSPVALSVEQIKSLLPVTQSGWSQEDYGIWIARAVERAHGIRVA